MKIHQKQRDKILRVAAPSLFSLLIAFFIIQLPIFSEDYPDGLSTQALVMMLGVILLLLRELGEVLFDYFNARHRKLPKLMDRLELLTLRIQGKDEIQWQSDELLLREFLEATGDNLASYNELSRFADFLAAHNGNPNIVTFKGINYQKIKVFEQALRIALQEVER